LYATSNAPAKQLEILLCGFHRGLGTDRFAIFRPLVKALALLGISRTETGCSEPGISRTNSFVQFQLAALSIKNHDVAAYPSQMIVADNTVPSSGISGGLAT
jgi:hypothetical protein